jgi:hypothetical protein
MFKVKDGNNFIIVRVNNERKPEGIPTVNADWWNYGGITREVLIVDVPEIFIDDYSIQLEKGKYDNIAGKITVGANHHLPLSGKQIILEIPELKIKQTLSTSEIWTEEYQAELYKQTLAMYNRVEGFAGTSSWILVDFYSPRRQLNGIQDFFNRKGLISNNGVKKQAFFVLQDFYKTKAEQ